MISGSSSLWHPISGLNTMPAARRPLMPLMPGWQSGYAISSSIISMSWRLDRKIFDQIPFTWAWSEASKGTVRGMFPLCYSNPTLTTPRLPKSARSVSPGRAQTGRTKDPERTIWPGFRLVSCSPSLFASQRFPLLDGRGRRWRLLSLRFRCFGTARLEPSGGRCHVAQQDAPP